MNEYLSTLLVFIFLGAFAFSIDRIVRSTKTVFSRDTGVFWFANLVAFIAIFSIFSLIYFFITFYTVGEPIINSGKSDNHYALAHSIEYLIGKDNILKYSFLWANIISIMWLLSVIFFVFLPSKIYQSIIKSTWHRSLVGTISSKTKSRKWILVIFLPPLILALLLPLPYLWDSFSSYPFFIYNSGLVVIIILTLIAMSKPAENSEKQQQQQENNSEQSKNLWPEKLSEGGVKLDYLGMIPATKRLLDNSSTTSSEFTLRANTFLKNGGAEELLEGIRDILTPGGGVRERHKQIRAQDDCGQIESVAIAAEALFLRYYTITLLIVPKQQIKSIRKQLLQFFDEKQNKEGDGRVFVLEEGKIYPYDDASMILLTDAKTLSDSFIDVLVTNKLILQRIGMVVWWNLHEYTGVLAGNMWAIIHRIHRLLDLKGRNDIRVMAFIRQAHNMEAELGRFCQDLLPFEFYPESIIDIPLRQSRMVYLYKLKGIETTKIDPIPIQEQQHTLLYAIRASIVAGWKTNIVSEVSCLTNEEMSNFLDRKEMVFGYETPQQLIRHIPDSVSCSHAAILQLNSKNALALTEIVSSLGRSLDDKLQYVGVICNGNNYIDFILKQFCKNNGRIFSSQALIAPKPNREIISKYLKKALYEIAITHSDIKSDFQFENKHISEVLKEVEKDNNLSIKEVRYLVKDKLKVEAEYKSNAGRIDDATPLDTNTTDLINIVAPTLGGENDGIRLRIDSHRVTILAYPGKIFYHGGRRFQIPITNLKEWQDWEETGQIHCRNSNRKDRTLRIRESRLYDCELKDQNIKGQQFPF